MDGFELERRIRETEERVRALLARTSNDDTWACQNELREAMQQLRELRAMRRGAAADEGAWAG
jgi:hypothetical protein